MTALISAKFEETSNAVRVISGLEDLYAIPASGISVSVSKLCEDLKTKGEAPTETARISVNARNGSRTHSQISKLLGVDNLEKYKAMKPSTSNPAIVGEAVHEYIRESIETGTKVAPSLVKAWRAMQAFYQYWNDNFDLEQPECEVELSSDDIFKGIRVHGRVDLICKRGKRIVITDWKTGKHKDQTTDVAQLSLYALMYSIEKHVPLSKIDIQIVHLREDSTYTVYKKDFDLEIIADVFAAYMTKLKKEGVVTYG